MSELQKHPIATFVFKDYDQLVVELLPENAPNTVASFCYGAEQGVYNGHSIERIVPGKWIDLSYSAFHKDVAKYLIPNEFKLHPEIKPLEVTAGTMCMGGYGEMGLAGCEIFFPLNSFPDLTGTYPVLGRVLSGMDTLCAIEQVETQPVTDFPYQGVEINKPVRPVVIDHVSIDYHGWDFSEPVKMPAKELPLCW